MAHSKSEIRKAKNLLNKYAPKGEQLAYINPKEANLLKRMGGAGKDVNVSGIKSYFDPGKGSGSVSESLSEAAGLGSSSSNNNNGGGGGSSSNDNAPQKKSLLSRALSFIGTAALTMATGGLFGIGKIGATALVQGAKFASKGYGYTNKNGRLIANAKLSGSQIFPDLNKKSNPNINMGGGDNTPPAMNVGGRIVKLSPTTAEISQSSATDASPYDNRKTKAKGRSMMIMTSSRGINRNNTLTLGKPSLLGA
jgi:hypothetical protein